MLSKIVLNILEKNPSTRSDDVGLWIEVLNASGYKTFTSMVNGANSITIPVEALKIKQSHVQRQRAYIQNTMGFIPS